MPIHTEGWMLGEQWVCELGAQEKGPKRSSVCTWPPGRGNLGPCPVPQLQTDSQCYLPQGSGLCPVAPAAWLTLPGLLQCGLLLTSKDLLKVISCVLGPQERPLGPLLPWHPMTCLGDSTARVSYCLFAPFPPWALASSGCESIPLHIPPPRMRPGHSEHWLNEWSSLCREMQKNLYTSNWLTLQLLSAAETGQERKALSRRHQQSSVGCTLPLRSFSTT